MGNDVRLMYKPHPWHGVPIGSQAPDVVTCYIEMVPTDTVKYEIDKQTGYLKVDRPQKFSNVCPTLYGFVPQTYCGDSVAALSADATGKKGIEGDGDPLDICVLTEKSIMHGDILVHAIPVGGLRFLDKNQADDKILAVLVQDAIYGTWKDINDSPHSLIERIAHYFLTYKDVPGSNERTSELISVYGSDEAREVIQRGRIDYQTHFEM